jgi:hypothetical protein
MHYDPRTIAFVAELLYPPMQLRTDLVQGVHNALFRQPAISYQSFQIAHDGIHLTNLPQQPGQVSAATFLPDRLLVREELRGTTVEDFATRVVNLATTAFQSLGIGTSVAQQFCVRSLVNPKHLRDGREFLAQRLLADQQAQWQAFGRQPQAIGLRLVFGPGDEHPGRHQVRIESWPHDPRSVWIENTTLFPVAIPAGDLPRIADELYATYHFLTGPVGGFLASYDQP